MSTRFRDDPRYAYLSSPPIPGVYGRAQKNSPELSVEGVIGYSEPLNGMNLPMWSWRPDKSLYK